MFRIWGKYGKINHLVRDMVSCNNDYSMSRTAMVFQALDEICHEFDLSQPIWLDSRISATFSCMIRRGLRRTVLLNRSILIIWNFR